MKKNKIVSITKSVLSIENADNSKALRRVIIKRDSDPQNPREWDNLFKLHSDCRYLASDNGAENPVVDYGKSPEEAKFKDGLFAIPLYAYVHSGIVLSLTPFNDRWDSGCAGFMYVDKKHYCEEMGLKRFSAKGAMKRAEAEVSDLNMYLTGDVYGFVVETRKEVYEDWEEEDSCWGFYGEEGIKDMLCEAGAYEKGTVVCAEDNIYIPRDEVTMRVRVDRAA